MCAAQAGAGLLGLGLGRPCARWLVVARPGRRCVARGLGRLGRPERRAFGYLLLVEVPRPQPLNFGRLGQEHGP